MANNPSSPWEKARSKADDSSKPRSRKPAEGRDRADAGAPDGERPARAGKDSVYARKQPPRDEAGRKGRTPGRPPRDDRAPRTRRSQEDAPRRSSGPRQQDADAAPARPRKERPARSERPAPRDEFEETPDFPQADRSNEYKIYGVNACMTAFKRRKDSIIRGYFSQSIAGKFGETMRYLAQQKKAYRVVEDDELERISQSNHHGGVCFLMKKRQPLTVAEYLAQLGDRQPLCLLILEGVGNPHNLGAILRNCAHFDVPAVLVDNANLLQSGAAARVAEGGAEWVELVEYDTVANLMEQLRAAGFSILATSSHQGRDLYRTEMPTRTAIFLGEESHGLKSDTLKASELCIRIPGTSHVESLNVSAATGVILGEFWRQHKSGSRTARTMAPAKAQPQGGRLKLKKGTGAA